MSEQRKIGEQPVYGENGQRVGTVTFFAPPKRFDRAMQLADIRIRVPDEMTAKEAGNARRVEMEQDGGALGS